MKVYWFIKNLLTSKEEVFLSLFLKKTSAKNNLIDLYTNSYFNKSELYHENLVRVNMYLLFSKTLKNILEL